MWKWPGKMANFMNIRSATPKDVDLIFSFIQKKAEFDRNVGAFPGILQVTEAKIQRTLFGNTPFAHVLFAVTSSQPIGFALYGFRYSSFVGQPSIWLDDLYINEGSRSQGAGAALMAELARIAQENGCSHLAWTAFDAIIRRLIPFYEQMINALVLALPCNSSQPIRVIDLGCGTGTIARRKH